MIDLKDPSMKEIVDDFCTECEELLAVLEDKLESFEDSEDAKNLEEFGQTIDRIMGAAATIGAETIGHLCKMGKIIGYKSSQSSDKKLNQVVAGVLFDLVDMLTELIKNLRQGVDKSDLNVDAFITRLEWLSNKFKHIDRASCDFEEGDNTMTTSELEALINQFKN